MYTDDKNAQVVLALLKKHGIKKIVVSPGMTNVPISRSVQVDPWFEVYSVVDERSAAYFACGLSFESGEPVVISCTGATASRNYLPGMTEAYYRNLPVIALTSQRHTSDFGNLVPQITDRTVSQNDVRKVSVQLPVVKDGDDLERCMLSVNKALIECRAAGGGPVHINLPVDNFTFSTKELPDVRKIDYIHSEDISRNAAELNAILEHRKVAIFIGAHNKMDQRLKELIEDFVESYNAAVIIDQTSSYRGKNSVLLTQIADLKQSGNLPSIVIDMGSITGDYSIGWLGGIETWRISEDGKIHDRFHRQTKLFDCSEAVFFEAINKVETNHNLSYYNELKKEISTIVTPDIPLSNTLVSKELSKKLPSGALIHLGILNSLRNMNLYSLDESIDSSSNVGGFGIDGPMSTLIGQSMVNSERLAFGLLGDLAAFYDMNALGIRHIKKNLRILLVNNNGGVEFRLNIAIEEQLADDTNEFISATGHNGKMQAWAESMGFHYMTANTKKDFLKQVKSFCSEDIDEFNKPVMFEVFTDTKSEQDGLNIIREANRDKKVETVAQLEAEEAVSVEEKEEGRFKKVSKRAVRKVVREIRKK